MWTRPLRELTPKTSAGFDVIEFWDWMRDRLEELDENRAPDDDTDYLSLLPRALEWQRWLLVHALELLGDGPDAVFRFRTVLLLVARQNGKSTIVTVLILWRMFQDGAKMTLETHASIDHALAAWQEACAIANAIPEMDDEIVKQHEGKGSVLLQLESKEQFKIATANRRGGRGFRGDLVIFDELRMHQDWQAWSATSKTTLARQRAQVWGVSNAGDLSAVVLRHLRKVALAAITGERADDIPEEILQLAGESIGLFEWSAGTVDGREDGPLLPIYDRDGWAQANPSMGLTELDERAIAASLSDPEWEFRTEVLCQFVNMAGAGPFPNGAWSGAVDTKQDREERGVTRDRSRPACYGLDMTMNRSVVYVAMAFWDTEGRVRVENVARLPGADWVLDWMQSPNRKVAPDYVAFQRRGAPVSSMWDEFARAGVDVHAWEGSELAAWHGQFYDLIRTAAPDETPDGETDEQRRERVRVSHGNQPALTLAAMTAQVKTFDGGGWVIDRKLSPEDAAPLMAAIAAVGMLLSAPTRARSAYEDRGLVVV